MEPELSPSTRPIKTTDMPRWLMLTVGPARNAISSGPRLWSEDEQERPIGFPVRVLNTPKLSWAVDHWQVFLAFVYMKNNLNEHLSRNVYRVHHNNSTWIIVSDQAPVREALSIPAPNPPTLVQSAPDIGSWIKIEDSDEQVSPEPTVLKAKVAPEQAPVVKIVQFIPKFKGAAEMEARRRERMAARRGPGGAVARDLLLPPLDFSSSSENEVEIPLSSASSELSSDESTKLERLPLIAVDGMDEGDKFHSGAVPVYYIVCIKTEEQRR